VPTLAELLTRHGPDYLARHGGRLPPAQRRALIAMLRCRTPAMGGHRCACSDCGGEVFRFHSCNHRLCPRCGGADTHAWLEHQLNRLLPVPYFLVTFTVPEALRLFARDQPEGFLDALFDESAATLQEIAAHPRHLGAELGFFGVYHSWNRTLGMHPHLHYIIPGGGLRPDHRAWRRTRRPDFLLPVEVLSTRFCSRMQERLRATHPEVHAAIASSVWRNPWVVHCQPAGSGESALKYLARYVFRTAFGGDREVLDPDDGSGRVSFQYIDSDTQQPRICTLARNTFIGRFLQHALPAGLHRIRYFGWMHPSARRRRLIVETLVQSLLTVRPRLPLPASTPWQRCCPHCGAFTLVITSTLPRAPP